MLSVKKLFLFDIDGTIALGDSCLPGIRRNFSGKSKSGADSLSSSPTIPPKVLRIISKNSRQMGVSTIPGIL